MKRRTLDIILSLGGLGIAILLVMGGLVLSNEASFAKDYVKEQLSQQQIVFTQADKLTADDKAYSEARTGCTIEYAGQLLSSGKQAECYANEYIGAHLSKMPAGTDGLTYAEIGNAQTNLKTQIAAAKASNDPGLAALEKQLADYTAARETVFKGEMLKGALLTSYGFSVMGEKAALAATIAFVGAAIMGALSLAGFVHAFVTPRSRAVFGPEPANEPKGDRLGGELTGA